MVYMFLENDKADVCDVDELHYRLRRPIEKGLAVKLDERLRHGVSILEETVPAPAHRHDEMKLFHYSPSHSKTGCAV